MKASDLRILFFAYKRATICEYAKVSSSKFTIKGKIIMTRSKTIYFDIKIYTNLRLVMSPMDSH